MSDNDLGWLAEVIESRRDASAESSYTARLFFGGVDRIARKVGEEATETVIAAVSADRGGDRGEVIAESADLIYHLLVLLAGVGVSLDEVTDELRRRHAEG